MAGKQHGRGVWRLAGLLGFGVAAVVALLLAWGPGSDEDPSAPRSALASPTASPSPTGNGLVLAADPFLTEADWSHIKAGSHPPVVRTDDQPRRLSPCLADPRGLGARVALGAAFLDPDESGINPPGRGINEYLLAFADIPRAVRAVADIREQIDKCAQPMNEMMTDFSTFPNLQQTPIEEGFDAGGNAGAVHHHITVARNGSLVVIVESTAWADRTFTTMNLAMVRAVPAEGERCPLIDLEPLCPTIPPTPAVFPTSAPWPGVPQRTWTSTM